MKRPGFASPGAIGRVRLGCAAGLLVAAGLACAAATAETASDSRAYLATIEPAADLQAFLDRTLAELRARDARLRGARAVRVALLDLPPGEPPRLAHHHGDVPIYPASVIKFVYLMAAYAWRDAGRLTIDPALDAEIEGMIFASSNTATQRVFAAITGTRPGPELAGADYADYRERRLAVQRWIDSLGVTGLHCVNPTYDGGGDLAGRDLQFVRDAGVPGGLPASNGELRNRNGMTAIGTVQILALLATDRAHAPETSAAVRQRMRRDLRRQPHLAARIAGGASRLPGLEVYAKSGTWGPIYADAGIVRDPASGHDLVIAAFTEGSPPYRGDFIAELTYRAVARVLRGGAESPP
jgi:beta-lactamase class A